MKRAAGIVAVLTLCAGLAGAQETLTYLDLISRLTDLERLGTLPAPGERCAQWSSWERSSVWDEASGKYVKWDANGDGTGFIREQGDSLVFAEIEGPGCIWRIWSARPEDGHVRVYLDGAETPAIDLPFRAYFDGTAEPFTRKTLCYEAAKGWNCYVPIPFEKSCLVVADEGWGRYYHFTYSEFPEGTKVRTFERELSADEKAALDAADALLSQPGADLAAERDGQVTTTTDFTVPAGGKHTVAKLSGPRAITSIRALVDLPEPPADIDALRELVLQIRWDGEEEPSVWAPWADFFGTAAGANQYGSLPMGLTGDNWWYSNWYMPFKSEAVVELVNEGKEPRAVKFRVAHAPVTAPMDTLGRFHAKWHRDAFLPLEPERWIDWTMVTTEGRGRFCGVNLHVYNPRGGWWGEGDEKFFVDGEKFPSTFGTGSEDYFGYAWGNPTLFARPYHNQTISMNNRGHISVNRWQITDNVPFQESFEGCIEKYFLNDRPCLFAATAYWYLAPGGTDPYMPVPVADRTGYYESTPPPVPHVRGAMEGEKLKVTGQTGGKTSVQELLGLDGEWSDGKHLWITEAKPGDRIDIALPVLEAGKYVVAMQFTKARDFGIVQVYLDGEKLKDPIDLFNPTVKPHGPFDMATLELTKDKHTLTIEIVGTNPKADPKNYMAGLDYVLLKPTK